MTDSLFFVFILISVLSYGIQGSLQTLYARRYDAVIVTVYRNLSLAFTMMPLLLFVTLSEVTAILDYVSTLLLASGSGAFALVCSLSSSRYLPIGVSSAIRQIFQVTVALILGVFFLGEYLTFWQFATLLTLAFLAMCLTLLRSDHPHLDPSMVWKGIGLTALSGIMGAISFYFFSILSRALHPFVSTYFWEVGVGVFTLFYLLFLLHNGRHQSPWPSFSDTWKVICISLLTISASVCYAFAVNHGPFALAGGMITMTTLVATVMGWVLYKEHLSRVQVGIICSAVALVFLLKVLS